MDSTIADYQQLQERYSSLADDELQAVAQDFNDLTDTAKMVLQSEMRRRALNFSPPSAVPQSVALPFEPEEKREFDPDNLDLAVVYEAWSLDEARNAIQVLHNAGIPCYMGPDNLEDADAYHSGFDKAVNIKVREADQVHASAALLALPPLPEDKEMEESEAGYAVHCPKCHSAEIVFLSLDNPSEDSSSTENFNWSCDSCGYQWKDTGIEERT